MSAHLAIARGEIVNDAALSDTATVVIHGPADPHELQVDAGDYGHLAATSFAPAMTVVGQDTAATACNSDG